MENSITEDVGRVVLCAGPEDVEDEEEEVGARRRSTHDFLTVAGTSGTS